MCVSKGLQLEESQPKREHTYLPNNKTSYSPFQKGVGPGNGDSLANATNAYSQTVKHRENKFFQDKCWQPRCGKAWKQM